MASGSSISVVCQTKLRTVKHFRNIEETFKKPPLELSTVHEACLDFYLYFHSYCICYKPLLFVFATFVLN